MKKRIAIYLKNKVIVAITTLIIVVIALILVFGDSNSSFETVYSELGTINQTVTVTGKVAADKKAELGFERGGVVAKIDHKVGDFVQAGDNILSLDSTDVYASLQSAKAGLEGEQARLIELQKGLRPEELSVENAKLKGSETSFEDARTTVINALHDSYVKTENSIYNYADLLFLQPQTVVPKINIRTENYAQEMALNNGRLLAGEKLRAWKSDLDNMNLKSDPIAMIPKVHIYMETIKTFLSDLSSIVNNLSPGNTGISQSTIDSYNSTMNTALSTFNTAVASLASAEATYRTASSTLLLSKDQYNLKIVGSSVEAIRAQSAKVLQARASVLSAEAEFAKKHIVSPINGVITKIQPELGEFVSAGQIASVIMSEMFKVEVNIPESDIAKISLGNSAKITLDAYDGSTIFNAHIVAVDPAETIVEGVPTYKVTLQFDEKDSRIRSGMTANIDIITNTKNNVVVVPFRAVIEKDGVKYVRIVNGDDSSNFDEVKVDTGIRGNNGTIEIVSGLDAGQKVITLVK